MTMLKNKAAQKNEINLKKGLTQKNEALLNEKFQESFCQKRFFCYQRHYYR